MNRLALLRFLEPEITNYTLFPVDAATIWLKALLRRSGQLYHLLDTEGKKIKFRRLQEHVCNLTVRVIHRSLAQCTCSIIASMTLYTYIVWLLHSEYGK